VCPTSYSVWLTFVGWRQILQLYLWAKYGGALGISMVTWDVFIMTKDEGGIGLINVVTQGSILVAK
jgi:hypothetical protein